MVLKKIENKLTVCKVAEISDIDLDADLFFIGKTRGDGSESEGSALCVEAVWGRIWGLLVGEGEGGGEIWQCHIKQNRRRSIG